MAGDKNFRTGQTAKNEMKEHVKTTLFVAVSVPESNERINAHYYLSRDEAEKDFETHEQRRLKNEGRVRNAHVSEITIDKVADGLIVSGPEGSIEVTVYGAGGSIRVPQGTLFKKRDEGIKGEIGRSLERFLEQQGI